MLMPGWLGWLALQGCWQSVDCSDPETVISDEGGELLACRDASAAIAYVELLAGRPLLRGDRAPALGAVRDAFEAAPQETLAWLGQLRAAGAELANKSGLDAAEARSTRVWRAERGQDLITSAHGALWSAQHRALGVWAKSDDNQLALTESDIEAWIRYASLCREAQGGGVLRVSMADRVTVYQELIDRFVGSDRATEVALASMGPIWSQVQDRWRAASYERQQEWIADAPLPPPMTATSLGYTGAVFGSDLVRHASVLHEVLGPFPIGREERFAAPPPLER